MTEGSVSNLGLVTEVLVSNIMKLVAETLVSTEPGTCDRGSVSVSNLGLVAEV